MATFVIYADSQDATVYSSSGTYATARSGSGYGTISGFTSDLRVGQVSSGGTYYCYEAFLSFDTSAVSGSIASATLSLYGDTDNSGVDFTVNARAKDWGTSADSADWTAGASLSGLSLRASLSTAGMTTSGYNDFTSDASFKSNVGSPVRLVLSSSRLEAGNTPAAADGVPANDERFYFKSSEASGTTQDPKLTIVQAGQSVALTPATETDAAVALTISPQRIALTPATETDSAVALSITAPSTLARVRSGLVSDTEWPDTLTGSPGWQTVGGATLGGTDAAKTAASGSTSEMVGVRRIVDLRHSGYETTTDLQLDLNWAISVDVPAGGATNAYSGVVIAKKDDTNYYALRASKTAGGTSSLVEVTSGTPATRASATADVSSGTKRIKLYRQGTRWGAVVDGQHFYYDDASPPGMPLLPVFGAQAASGTSAYTYSNVDICVGNTIEVAGLNTGEAVRIYDAGGTLVASAVESGGIASLDLAAVAFPFTGYIRVFTDNTYATQASAADRWPGMGTAQFHGGDRLHAHFGADTATIGLKVVTNDAHSSYATIQYNSRSGIVHDGAMYGLVMGKRGKVYAYKLDLATGRTLDYVYVGDCADQHDSLDMTADGNGYLHIVYGGTYANSYRTENTTYHRVSARPWDVQEWQARTDLGKRFALLTTDKNGAVHMFAGVFGTYLEDIKHRIWSGGSWGSETTVIQRAATTGGVIGWNNYPCDFAPSHDKSRLHAVGYSYGDPGGSGVWKNAWHLYYDVDAGVWKKLDGTTVTLPATQNASTGTIAAIDTFQSGDAYTPIVTVDSNGDLWAVVPKQVGGYPENLKHQLYKGTLGGSWSSVLKTFDNVWSKGCLAFTGSESGLVFIAPASKDSSRTIPWDIRRWTCEDGKATNGSSTWRERVMYDGSLDGGRHYWPRMAVVNGEDYFKVTWHSRYSLYGSDPSTALYPAMDGVSTVYLADIAATLTLTPATETDTAVGLSYGRPFSITPTTETDAAVTLSVSKRVTLTPATETDAAVGLTVTAGSHTVALTPATETDAAVALTTSSGVHHVTLTAATETDSAVVLSLAGPTLTGTPIPLPATADFVSARSQTADFVSAKDQTADFIPGAT